MLLSVKIVLTVLDSLVFPLLSLLAFGGFQTSLQLAKDDDEHEKGMGHIYATLFIHCTPMVTVMSLVVIWLPLFEELPLQLHVVFSLLPALVLILFLANLMTFEVGRGQVIRSARALLNRGRGHIFDDSMGVGDSQSISSLRRTNRWEWWESFRSKRKREDLTAKEEMVARKGTAAKQRCSKSSQPDGRGSRDGEGRRPRLQKHDDRQKPVDQVIVTIEAEDMEPEVAIALASAKLDEQLQSRKDRRDACTLANSSVPTHVFGRHDHDGLQVGQLVGSRTQTLSSAGGSVLLDLEAPSIWRTLTECPWRLILKWIDTWASPLDPEVSHGEEREVVGSAHQNTDFSTTGTGCGWDHWSSPLDVQSCVQDNTHIRQSRLGTVIRNSACFLAVFLPALTVRMALFAVLYAALTPPLVLVFTIFFPVASILCSFLHMWEAASHSATQTSGFHVFYTPATMLVWLVSSPVAVLVAPTMMCGLWVLGIAIWGGWRGIPVVGQLEAEKPASKGSSGTTGMGHAVDSERRKADSAQFTCAASCNLETKASTGERADDQPAGDRPREDDDEERAIQVMLLPDVPALSAPLRYEMFSSCARGRRGDFLPGATADSFTPKEDSAGITIPDYAAGPAGMASTASVKVAGTDHRSQSLAPHTEPPLVVNPSSDCTQRLDKQLRPLSSSSSSSVRRSRRTFWVTPRLYWTPRPFNEVVTESCWRLVEDIRRQKLFIFG